MIRHPHRLRSVRGTVHSDHYQRKGTNPMNKHTLLGAIAAVLAVGTLAACGAATDESPVAVQPPVTNAPTPEAPEPDTTDASFGAAFHDAYGDTMDTVTATLTKVGEAASDLDTDEAQRYAAKAADLFEDLLDGVAATPGADTDLGHTFSHTFEVCRDAYGYTAELFDGSTMIEIAASGDLDDATSKIKDCTGAMGEATEATLAA